MLCRLVNAEWPQADITLNTHVITISSYSLLPNYILGWPDKHIHFKAAL